jgi:hypothetical protein
LVVGSELEFLPVVVDMLLLLIFLNRKLRKILFLVGFYHSYSLGK